MRGITGDTFSYTITKDPATGWHIVQLNAENPEDSGKNISVKITPEGGCYFQSWRENMNWFMHRMKWINLSNEQPVYR